jgi:glycerol-3-phosphate dehydrogenase (NAD(P)+)
MNFPVDIIKKYCADSLIYILSGPSFAEEVYEKMHTAVVLAGDINKTAKKIQKQLSSNFFRVYLNEDALGVELSSALKNVMAIASGMIEGLGLGKNTRSALITRGLAEITRLGKQIGADMKTFSGLAGMGDLILTCTDSKSRNYSFGKLLAKNYSADDALNNAGGIVEGYYTVKNAEDLSQKFSVEMPITKAVYDVIYNNAEIENIINRLMQRELKNELWGL